MAQAAAPLWIIAAIAVDALRRSRGVALRSSAVLAICLSCEVLGLILCGGLWLWRQTFGMAPER